MRITKGSEKLCARTLYPITIEAMYPVLSNSGTPYPETLCHVPRAQNHVPKTVNTNTMYFYQKSGITPTMFKIKGEGLDFSVQHNMREATRTTLLFSYSIPNLIQSNTQCIRCISSLSRTRCILPALFSIEYHHHHLASTWALKTIDCMIHCMRAPIVINRMVPFAGGAGCATVYFYDWVITLFKFFNKSIFYSIWNYSPIKDVGVVDKTIKCAIVYSGSSASGSHSENCLNPPLIEISTTISRHIPCCGYSRGILAPANANVRPWIMQAHQQNVAWCFVSRRIWPTQRALFGVWLWLSGCQVGSVLIFRAILFLKD